MSTEKLKETIQKVFPDVETVICWQEGFDKLHTTPLFITAARRLISRLECALRSEPRRLSAITEEKSRRFGQGLRLRTIVQFMQEGLIDRNNVVIIGIPCRGVVSVKKVLKAIDFQPIEDVKCSGDTVIVKPPKGETTLKVSDVWPDKCKTCQYPTPVIYDFLIGDAIESDKPAESVYEEIREFDAKSLEERKAYFDKEFSKCIRCYACRNACPMCVCQDSCIAERVILTG